MADSSPAESMSSSHVPTARVAVFLQIIAAAAAANNSDEFDCVCCFSITHNFFLLSCVFLPNCAS